MTQNPDNFSNTTILIDGYGYVFRAFHALPPFVSNGVSVNAVFGFMSMMIKLLQDKKPRHAAIIFDGKGKNFRHALYDQYKANRPPAPEELIMQFPIIREAANALGLCTIEKDGFEADDLIASLSKMAVDNNESVIIVSSDKDLMQLIDNQWVMMYDPIKARMITKEMVLEKFGVMPDKLLDVLALMGDSSDNVPGVRSIGPKSATELINEFDTIENIYLNIDKIKQVKRKQALVDNYELAILSKKLITLKNDVELDFSFDNLALHQIDHVLLHSFLEKYSFKTLAARIGKLPNLPKVEVEDVKVSCKQADSITEVLSKINNKAYCFPDIINKEFLGMLVAFDHECFYLPKELASELLANDDFVKIIYDSKDLMHFADIAPPYDDLMIMAYIIRSDLNDYSFNKVAANYLGKIYEEKATLLTDRIQILAEKATDLIKLYPMLKLELTKASAVNIYEKIDKPLIPVLVEMEKTGIKIDKNKLEQLSEEFRLILLGLEKEIYKEAKSEFNIGSPKQLSEILFKNMGIASGKSLKSGALSTNAKILEDLSEQGYAIADLLLEWRQISKLKNTYTDALQDQISPITKRIHTHFSNVATTTGRLSSSDPNLQNIPIRSVEGNKIREAFIVEEGFQLLSADYSQIELRLLAHLADIPALKEAFAHNVDIHSLTASQIFSVDITEVDAMMRRKAKAINFGIIYGISAFGLAKQLGVARADAGNYIKAYFERYPGIQNYMEKTKEFARLHGYVETLMKRKCFIKSINDKNHALRSFGERAAINAPLQGTASDIAKIAMINVAQKLRENNLKTKMLLQVHDELLFEVPNEEQEVAINLIKTTMESVVLLDVPLIVSVNVGKNWASIH